MRARTVIAGTLAALAAGCSASRSYRAPASAPGRQSAGVEVQSTVSTASVGEEDSPPSHAPAAQPASVDPRWRATPEPFPAPVVVTPTPQPTAPATPANAAPDPDADEARALREGRIGAQVQRIRDEQIRLAANPGVCHDVCFAAGSICLAAQEVCRLAGDADPRCGRARTACTDAGRQRDGSCPACPPAH